MKMTTNHVSLCLPFIWYSLKDELKELVFLFLAERQTLIKTHTNTWFTCGSMQTKKKVNRTSWNTASSSRLPLSLKEANFTRLPINWGFCSSFTIPGGRSAFFLTKSARLPKAWGLSSSNSLSFRVLGEDSWLIWGMPESWELPGLSSAPRGFMMEWISACLTACGKASV